MRMPKANNDPGLATHRLLQWGSTLFSGLLVAMIISAWGQWNELRPVPKKVEEISAQMVEFGRFAAAQVEINHSLKENIDDLKLKTNNQ